MKYSHFSALALAFVSTACVADISYTVPGSDTTVKFGGYINAGTHQRRGDQTDWNNVYARQTAADFYQSVAGNNASSAANVAAAKAQYERTLAATPYWENLDTSASDIYFRLQLGAEQNIRAGLKAFAYLERDFRTKRTDLRSRQIAGNTDDDVTRRAFVGLEGDYGQLRFGRDESALDHVRALLYAPIEKDGYEYHVLVQPVSAMGRHDNSLIYSYDAGSFGFTAGAAFRSQEDFVSESSQSASARYTPLPGLTLATGYAGGQLKTDTEGSIVQPDLTFLGLSAHDVSKAFDGAAYNPRFKLDQRQFNLGAAYQAGNLSLGATVFEGRYRLAVSGEDVNRAASTGRRDYDMRGAQASARYQFNRQLGVAALYTRSENRTSRFTLINVASVSLQYQLTPSFLVYGSVGRDSSDASHATVGNAGVRFGF